ncbi:MAG: hypothetical protein KME11_04820 [Timaviella obliquedivisa GSE-PSE-MK23-08B]|nr:hypothetical protein [Timaviella obliquedivisa GSE-PSE-MK23-08B]
MSKQVTRDDRFDVRYGKRWRYNRKWKRSAHLMTGGICCLCAKNKSETLHHVRYVDDAGKPLVDREVIGRDIFPVCESCHDRILHSASTWHRDKVDPVWLNQNLPEYQLLLKSRFRQLKKP